MKLFTFIISLLFCMGLSNIAIGQTIYSHQDNNLYLCPPAGACAAGSTAIPNATYTGVFSVAATQYTDWILANTQGRVCFDVTLVDADSTITSVDLICYGAQSNAGAVGTGVRQVVYGTVAAGVTPTVPSSLSQTATGGGAPGSSSWQWCITQISSAFIMCSFTGQGAPTALIDTIAVEVRGVTP